MTINEHNRKVVLASGNPGKLKEFQSMLASLDMEVHPQSDYFSDSADETGLSFVENAILKARFACKKSGLPAIADDSGIEVDALLGAPGIYSARFAGPQASDQDNNQKLVAALSDTPPEKRSARYQCVLVFMRHAADPVPLVCQSSWEGRIVDTPKGEGGFGYDPHFYLPDLGCTAAELEKADKNRISHRGKAMQSLLEALQEHAVI